MKGGDMSSVSPLVSFVLGAAMATVCVLFFMSATPARRLVDISAFTSAAAANNNSADLHRLASNSADSDAADADSAAAALAAAIAIPAPAPAPVQVRAHARTAVRRLTFPCRNFVPAASVSVPR